jgi:transposase
LTFEGNNKKSDNGTMSTIKIPTEQWKKIYSFLKSHSRTYTNNQEATRHFIEAVFWIMRTGAQWREIPSEYGDWNSIYKRFARWEENGVWASLYEYCIQEPDLESVILDSTVIRSHMCASGGSKKTVGKMSKR